MGRQERDGLLTTIFLYSSVYYALPRKEGYAHIEVSLVCKAWRSTHLIAIARVAVRIGSKLIADHFA